MQSFHNNSKLRGTVLIYVLIAMVAFTAMMSLVVDVAHARLVKTQLQGAADAAARHGVTGLWAGNATSNALAAAAYWSVDGSAVVLQSSDVITGTWVGGNTFVGSSGLTA